MLYKGSCHCGNIVFEVEGKIEAAVVCNCSICSRKGALLWAVPRGALRLLTSDEGVGRYTFNNRVIEHRFCQTCGMNPYAEDAASQSERSAYINIRCVEGVDIAAIPTAALCEIGGHQRADSIQFNVSRQSVMRIGVPWVPPSKRTKRAG